MLTIVLALELTLMLAIDGMLSPGGGRGREYSFSLLSANNPLTVSCLLQLPCAHFELSPWLQAPNRWLKREREG